jgi:predicted AlkP superfamily phosphohydrolase/phosphomutase
VYINLNNRESNGIVQDKEQVIQEIITKLEKFKDKKTGKNVVNKVYRTSEIYSGDYVGDGPDLIIGYNPGYRASSQTAIGGFDTETISDNLKEWGGDHLVDPIFVPGVFFANVKLTSDSISQLDIAPTALDALGIKIPEEMDGESLLR